MNRRVAAIVVAMVVLVACGDDKQPAASDTDAASSAPSTTRSSTTTSSTTTSTSTTVAGCSGTPGVPAAATNTADAPADVDGDGTADIVRTFRLGETWHLVAELSSGGVTKDVSVPATEVDPGALRIIGGTNLSGGDERAELLVVQGAGASTLIVVLYQLVGCELVRIQLPGGAEAGFPVGGGVLQRGLLSCGGFEEEPVNWLFEQSASRASDEEPWVVTTIGYSMGEGAPPQLVQAFGPQSDPLDDEQMSNRPSFKCDDLSLP